MKGISFFFRLYRRRNARGQFIVLATLGLTALIGLVGLAIDIGYIYSARRQLQTAADAAAIAGVNAQLNNQSSGSQQTALDIAALNGFTNGKNGVTINVGPPATPPNPSTNTYVEVDIAQAVRTIFLSVLGYPTLNVSVRAVAGTRNATSCLYALDPSAPGAISLNGNFTINANCSVVSNSSSSSSLQANGSGTLIANSIGVAGNYSVTGSVTLTPTPHINVAPLPNPLASIAPPTVGTCSHADATNSGILKLSANNQTVTIPPGVYRKGIAITGTGDLLTFSGGNYGNNISLGPSIAQATFNPGQYQSGATGDSIDIAGGTVVFNPGQYTFCGAVSLSGSNRVTLSPGLYSGGISVSSGATVTFNPGNYVLAGGGLTVSGSSTLTGSSLVFYNTSGSSGYAPITLSGNETANLSAPTSGPYVGILFFQDPSVANSKSNGSSIVGNATSTFDGILYFPTTSLSYVGNSSSNGYTFLIADTISLGGNATSRLGSDYSTLPDGSPIKSTALYE